MTRLILREVARWRRALGAPLAVLLVVVVTPVLLPPEMRPLVADPALSVGWLAALIAAAIWLTTSATRAALQPARDRRAFERLQDLRARAGLPDHLLVCILRTLWSTPAGERVDAVDVRTGALVDLWLAEASLSRGSYALLKRRGGALVLIEGIPPGRVVAAQRYARCDRQGRIRRQQRRAEARVVRAAEMLLR